MLINDFEKVKEGAFLRFYSEKTFLYKSQREKGRNWNDINFPAGLEAWAGAVADLATGPEGLKRMGREGVAQLVVQLLGTQKDVQTLQDTTRALVKLSENESIRREFADKDAVRHLVRLCDSFEDEVIIGNAMEGLGAVSHDHVKSRDKIIREGVPLMLATVFRESQSKFVIKSAASAVAKFAAYRDIAVSASTVLGNSKQAKFPPKLALQFIVSYPGWF